MIDGIEIGVYVFRMKALETMYVPEFKGGMLRGAFGTTFKRIACPMKRFSEVKSTPEKSPCRQCPMGFECPYRYIFEPSPPDGSERLRNLQDIPRPFALQVPLDTRTIISAGDYLEWKVVLIGKARKYLPYFLVTFEALGENGMGSWHQGRRSKASLDGVYALNPLSGMSVRVYDGDNNVFDNSADVFVRGEELLEAASRMNKESVTVDFRSITRLKYKEEITRTPEFHILVRNLLRRLSTLSYFYSGKAVEADFISIIQEAQTVKFENLSVQWKDWERYSGRSKDSMDFGGIIGRARYSGDVAKFMPLLLFGSLVNVGKGSTFGLGQIAVEA